MKKYVKPQEICNSDELNYCNERFTKTRIRKADGKYVVSMPLKPELPEIILGNSKMIASKRLDQLWTRLERDPTMKRLLPYHSILRPDKTTKLRVVFNASAKTTTGYSLNDLLYKGGVLQEDLFSILIYAFTADIQQMFRIIELNESHTRLQKILRKNSK
ncbi:integrase catalytic domain-containing protein [Trichonephila clavipes]|nr:integrase catalytic domain-containing protein [Trichonephila clavipes]